MQAQGLWRMLQGKPKDEREEQAQRAERERLEKLKIDNEWAGGANSGMWQPCLADPLPLTAVLLGKMCCLCHVCQCQCMGSCVEHHVTFEVVPFCLDSHGSAQGSYLCTYQAA